MRGPFWTLIALLPISVAWSQDGAPRALSGELRALLEGSEADARIPVIVRYRAATDGTRLRAELADETHEQRRRSVPRRLRMEAGIRAAAIIDQARQGGAQEIQPLWIANAVSLQASPALLLALAANPEVLDIRPDAVLSAPIAYPGLALPAEWNLAMVDAPSLWQRGLRGQGVVIASLDSGVDARHPDLSGAYRGGTNSWFDPHGQHSLPSDTNGHGTQVMGILVGGDHGGTHVGVAPDAKWIAAKIFDDAGATNESAIHRALQWLLDPDGNPATDDAPDVVNNSWDISAEDSCNSAFQSDIDALRAADIAVVFSAGNYGPTAATSVSPANTAHVTSVGAIDDQQQVALFSSRGPSACDDGLFPRLVAPGDGILTTDLSFGGMAAYTLVAGTSFASPHVAGAMALLRSASPLVSVEQMETALVTTARDIGSAGPDQDSGYGLINLPAALAALPPTDLDGDGYGAGRDCNDRDPTVHPGASEKARDGIDQDCNGLDLSISIKYAVYSHDGAILRMRVTSARRAEAGLEIDGVGALTWRAPYADWIFESGTGEVFREITVRGPEGAVTVRPRQPTRRR